MTMTQRTPTESMRASAQAHLELRDDWRYYRKDGIRYVAMISANSGKVHQVRADGRGCDCDAYLVWQYTACSHMLSIRESLNRDAIQAWVDEQPAEPLFPRCRSCGARTDIQPCSDCCAALTRRLETAGRRALAGSRPRYEDIWQEED